MTAISMLNAKILLGLTNANVTPAMLEVALRMTVITLMNANLEQTIVISKEWDHDL